MQPVVMIKKMYIKSVPICCSQYYIMPVVRKEFDLGKFEIVMRYLNFYDKTFL